MKKMIGMKRLIVILAIAALCGTGCASFGVWSADAQAKLTAFTAWANQWVGGAAKEAPAIIAEASKLLGGSGTSIVADANAGLATLQSLLGDLNNIAQAGTSANTAQANIVAAIQSFSQTMGVIQAAIAAAKPATATPAGQ